MVWHQNHSEESTNNNQVSDVRTGASTNQYQISVIENKQKKTTNSPDIFISNKTSSFTERHSHYQTDIKNQKDDDNTLKKESLTFES